MCVWQVRPLQHAPWEVGTAQLGAPQVRVLKVDVPQIQLWQIRPLQVQTLTVTDNTMLSCLVISKSWPNTTWPGSTPSMHVTYSDQLASLPGKWAYSLPSSLSHGGQRFNYLPRIWVFFLSCHNQAMLYWLWSWPTVPANLCPAPFHGRGGGGGGVTEFP